MCIECKSEILKLFHIYLAPPFSVKVSEIETQSTTNLPIRADILTIFVHTLQISNINEAKSK